ncbi:hypothetical protein [Terrabacter sp. NPDC080008]|uniref:hypothetical protein n=1 Tax=Terrabacter sp. NPDC080008 TaxID=3155176 RepID=UPI00344C5CEF
MTPHLKGHVRAYVDRALPPAMLHLYDKHLVCCHVCRVAADQERRIVAALRADTGVPMSLRTSLMGLAAAAPGDGGASDHGGHRVPPVPDRSRMPSVPFHEPVPTVPPTAPALHRSPMRAAVVASIAAGASVAAAWGLAVSPSPAGRLPSVRGPVANFGGSPASAVSFGGSVLPADRVAPPTGDSRRSELGSGAVPYWLVSTRSAAEPGSPGRRLAPGLVSGVVDSVRITTVRSAQSTP